MDLGAYTKIEDLSKVAEENGIIIPRLRGYRLMSEEKPLSKEEITNIETNMIRHVYKSGCCSVPRFCPASHMHEFSRKTKALENKFLDENGNLRWNLLHGKERKRIKFAVKKVRQAVRNQYETFNKYAGRNDVLYIHARIGGNNWNDFQGYMLEKTEWFLEKIDDCFDSTYCDIYAKIKPTMS